MTYHIAIIRDWYQDSRTGDNALGWMDKEYPSIEEARAEVKEQDGWVYETVSGEAGRPEYLIVSDDDRERIKARQEDQGSSYDWSGNPCGCGACRDCLLMMEDQDIEYIREHAIK